MKTIIKRLDVRNARLYSISSGKRLHVADFQGMVEIVEHKTTVSILGQRYKGEKKVYASFLISDDIEYQNEEEFHSGKVYEATGTVQGDNLE